MKPLTVCGAVLESLVQPSKCGRLELDADSGWALVCNESIYVAYRLVFLIYLESMNHWCSSMSEVFVMGEGGH